MSTEVQQVYKQTEAGIIPKDWSHQPLATLCTKITTGKLDANAMNENGEYPFFTCAREVYSINKYAFDTEALLVSGNGANVGYVHYYRGKFNAYQRTYVLNGFLADVQYLKYFMERNLQSRLRTEVNAGNTPYIVMGTLTEMAIILPASAKEQRAIATALSDMDALISGLDQLIAKKRDIKQATMQQLLTGKKRLPGFSGKWSTLRLEAICAFITKGSTPTTYGFGWESSGVLFLRSECVAEQGLDLSQSMFISNAAHNTLRRSEICGGDLLITITGNVGRVILLPDGFPAANINQHIARVRVISPGVDFRFVYHFLSVPDVRKKYNSITTGQAYPQISLKQVRETEIRLPALSEQVAIAQIISDMDTELTTLESRRDKAKQLKQGMMQELLTGRIRLL